MYLICKRELNGEAAAETQCRFIPEPAVSELEFFTARGGARGRHPAQGAGRGRRPAQGAGRRGREPRPGSRRGGREPEPRSREKGQRAQPRIKKGKAGCRVLAVQAKAWGVGSTAQPRVQENGSESLGLEQPESEIKVVPGEHCALGTELLLSWIHSRHLQKMQNTQKDVKSEKVSLLQLRREKALALEALMSLNGSLGTRGRRVSAPRMRTSRDAHSETDGYSF